MVAPKSTSKEYFPESVWGVKASPRVSNLESNLPRGGGRDQLGQPYKVRGKMYYPKEDKNYKKVGYASWYGDAFHGRLTANGEIYDKTHLTAAHPTMPLPSYARVTNLETGSSVIVRVNDRGPYSNGRLIDLSQRAADVLAYRQSGTAKVKVEYVGRAPLHGQDDSFLMASYRPGNRAPDPSDGLPSGVMIAMNGPTPSAAVRQNPVAAFPGTLTDVVPSSPPSPEPFMTASASTFGEIDLPAFGPIAPERPAIEDIIRSEMKLAMSYAPQQVEPATRAFDVLQGGGQADAAASALPTAPAPFIAAGTFYDQAEAMRVGAALSNFGKTDVEPSTVDGQQVYSVMLHEDGRSGLNELLIAAWKNGAPEAIAVRD
jgi:rare lipoprotein A